MFGAICLWSLLIWGSLVSTCCGYVDFIYPSTQDKNLVFNYIDVVYFTWASSVDQPWMNLWCAPNPSLPQSKDYGKSYRQYHPRSLNQHSTINQSSKNNQRKLTRMKRNSIPRPSPPQRQQPPILPLHRLQPARHLPHASRKLLQRRQCKLTRLRHHIRGQRQSQNMGNRRPWCRRWKPKPYHRAEIRGRPIGTSYDSDLYILVTVGYNDHE